MASLPEGGGQAKNSRVPTLAVDTDNDGYIEVSEGATTYGDILLPLGDIGTDSHGNSTFSMSYDLNNQAIFNNGYLFDDLVPFRLREVVIHGLTVPDGEGAGPGNEVNGSGGYIAVLPVAAGEITPGAGGAVPEPATWAMLVLGFGAIGGTLRLRKNLAPRVA